jgi:hypothetical protein
MYRCLNTGNVAQFTRVADVMCVPIPDDISYAHAFAFNRAQEAFDTFASRKSGKVLLLPWEETD